MHQDRIKLLNISANKGKYIIYWMQQSMRVNYNHALDEAIRIANKKNKPLLVYFFLTDTYLGANLRHYMFMLESLKEVEAELVGLNIPFIIKYGNVYENIKKALIDCDTLIMDYGYLKPQLKWRREIYDYIITYQKDTGIVMVESDVLIPVRTAYNKLAYGAYAIRPSIMKKYHEFLDFEALTTYLVKQTDFTIKSDVDFNNIEQIINTLDIDKSVMPYKKFIGGRSNGIKLFRDFLDTKINDYQDRSDPSLSIQSYLSIYLHFGNISVLEVLAILDEYMDKKLIRSEDYSSFFEQLIVRRELAFNFVTYQQNYDMFEYMTENWAYETMHIHETDKRDYLYSSNELEHSMTHDRYFNAAMDEMRITGFMANYMRMYWAKKIIEWSDSFKIAYETIVYLNNKYFLDGRDANSYVNIAWCFGKNDRAWTERTVFGKLRYMNDKGLERKFNINEYVNQIETLKTDKSFE